jgi:hypothetical protein
MKSDKKSAIFVSIIWLVFMFIFVILGFSHLKKSKQEIPNFKITKVLSSGADAEIKVGGVSIEKPFQDFANEFNNKYLEQQNKSNREANRIAAWGYFVASLTSLFSAVLEWILMLRKKSECR